MTYKETKVAAELQALESKNGLLRPEDVIFMAKDPSTASHSYFTWDNDKAAKERRMDQARALIRTVHVDISVNDITVRVCRYLKDPESDHNVAGYRNITVVRKDEDLARDALVDEMKRVGSAVKRARNLAIVFNAEDAVAEIDALAKSVIKRVSLEEHQGAQ